MVERVRRQHVVSRFYLNGFASDTGRVRRVSLPGESEHVLSTGDAAVIKDFYTITLPDGTQSDVFEKVFGEIEGPASEALRKLLSGTWPITGDHRVALATWIALQHLRAEDVRASQGSMNAQFIRLIVGTAGKEALRELIEGAESRDIPDAELDHEWEDITKPGGPDLVPDVKQHIGILMDLLPRMAAYLHDCHWTVFRFNRRSIVTSDHPVNLVPGDDHPEWSGVGIATAELFLIPLSRRAALTIQPHDRFPSLPPGLEKVPDFQHDGTTQVADSINQETVLGARKYVHHHPEDSPLGRLHLPDPDRSIEPSMSDASDLIREKGLFSDMTDEQREAWGRMSPASGERRGVSIKDLPWPIPGRRQVDKM
ncbi:DUF4238 domain-containing protein [Nocardioides astragali]|uniref:DUF4238 domain-containing protein n=1 Tax=Nocardioides astragali TaxID=1776736 RepID=A0ABW2N5F2_9ACTN|nr:DUF4238 domain-containing protein [Nocardioides astragali]